MPVLTNISRNDLNSRPYWPGGGYSRGPAPGRAPGETDRAPQGWVQGRPPPPYSTPGPIPTHSSPCRASGARFAGMGTSPGSWVVPRYSTHPVPTQSPYPCCTPSRAQCSLHVHGARYSRFWRSVGEPRGLEYRRVSGSQAGYIQLSVLRLVCTAV